MKNLRIGFIVVLLGWQSLLPVNAVEVTGWSEVGYCRRFWDTETLEVTIECANGRVECRMEEVKTGKRKTIMPRPVSLQGYLELWEYINANAVLDLKSASLGNTSLTEAEWEALYGRKIPRQYSYIYDFHFKIGRDQHTFTVDDIGYVKDGRYREVLNKINGLLNIKTEINVFGEDSKQ